MKRRTIPQPELGFPSEPFALVREATADGERIVKEREQSASDRAECEAKQPGLAPGSYWASPMAKALATMQGGR